MRDFTGFRTVILLTPPVLLLLPLSMIAIALERISNSLYAEKTTHSWRTGSDSMTFYGPTTSNSTGDDKEYINVTYSIDYSPTLAVIGVSIAACVAAVIGACGIWELRRIEGTQAYQRGWSWVVVVLNTLVALGSVAVLVWASVLSQRGWKRYEDVGKQNQRFARETWLCQINKFFPHQNWAGPACGFSQATRYLLIPLAISAGLVLFSAWMLIRERGGIRWFLGGKGRYAGFDVELRDIRRPQDPKELSQQQPLQPPPYPEPHSQVQPNIQPRLQSQAQIQPQTQSQPHSPAMREAPTPS